VTDRFIAILLQKFRQAFDKGAKLGMRLGGTFVLLVGYTTPDDISDGIAGKVQVEAYLTNSFPVSKMGLTNFTESFHVQHLLLILLPLVDFREDRAWDEVGHF
jgi:hypothetical protein